MVYAVATPVFAGPLDVLLQLVNAQDVDIYEIPLTEVVDGFLAHLASVDGLDLELTTEFLLIAAILIELKSRRLLPVPEAIVDDEEIAGGDERDLLLARLLECATFGAAGRSLQVVLDAARRSVPRQAGMEERFARAAPDLLSGVTPDHVRAAFARAIAARAVPIVDLGHVVVDRVSVAEAVAALIDELPALGRATFRRITEGLDDRMEIIVRFLALLELCKQGRVHLDQGENFGELTVQWEEREPALSAALATGEGAG